MSENPLLSQQDPILDEDHIETISRLRRIADEEDMVLALLGDLQGPKIRMGDFETIYLNPYS